MKDKILLQGRSNKHVLKGVFVEMANNLIEVKEALLHHEKPIGGWSEEHHTLKLPIGIFQVGKQVEFNPFTREVTDIFD